MKRSRAVMAAAGIIAGGLVVGPFAEPAGAAVTATGSGTTVTVTMTGDGNAQFQCISSKVNVNFTPVAPTIACTALTQVTVTGDSGNQTVYGDQLNVDTFPLLPKLVATMAGGSDFVTETLASDNIDMGLGDDTLQLYFGANANVPSPNLGTGGSDGIAVVDTVLYDNITFSSTGTSMAGSDVVGGGLSTISATNGEYLTVYGSDGDDSISTAGITLASSIDAVTLFGGTGDDHLTAGPDGAYLAGNDGTNTLTGGIGSDQLLSASTTDTVDPGDDASTDYLYDDPDSLHAGGRTYSHLKAADVFSFSVNRSDAVVRVRPGATAGTTLATMSVTKFGQQVLPNSLGYATAPFGFVGRPAHRAIFDAVAGGIPFNTGTFASDSLIADFTIPTGSWTVTTGTGYVKITPTDGSLKYVSANEFDAYKVHGPWTNRNQGFAHRVTRDLMFRFATDASRDLVRDQLTAGTTTRLAVANNLMNTDEYRGLDVDRVFLDYLRRVSDASGRTYWINSLRSGKPLIKFRAQLFGSSEYFNKAGATNASYMVKAYADVLGRKPDPSGQAYWTNKLNTGTGRGSVALQFLASTEARRNIVKNQFLRFLDRLPTEAESTTWVTNLDRPHGEEELIAFLAASGAYFNRS